MKIKATILFQLFEYRWSFVVYYAVILLVLAINIIAGSLASSHDISISGTEYSTAVFLFITGVMFMRVQFPFFLQNGVSRRTTFVTSLLNAGIMTVGMSILTNLLTLMVQCCFSKNISAAFFVIYMSRYGYDYTAATFFEGLLWNFALNLLFYFMGLFLSAMLYRLSRLLRLIVFAGLGATFVLILPGIDITITHGEIFKRLGHIALFALGLQDELANPYIAVASFLIVGALFAGGNYLFLRRATVKP